MTITENNELVMKNMVSLRKETRPNETNKLLNEISAIFADGTVKKTTPYINVTHGIKQRFGKAVLDLEILVGVDHIDKLPRKYRFLPELTIHNSVKCSYEGSPFELSKCGEAVEQYIKDKGLDAVTPGYLVTIKEAENEYDIKNMKFELYVGIRSDRENSL